MRMAGPPRLCARQEGDAGKTAAGETRENLVSRLRPSPSDQFVPPPQKATGIGGYLETSFRFAPQAGKQMVERQRACTQRNDGERHAGPGQMKICPA